MVGCVLGVVWCATVVCFVPVGAVWALVNAGGGGGRVPVARGGGGSCGGVAFNVVAVVFRLFAGFLVDENGVLVSVEVIVGAGPYFACLRGCGAFGRTVGCFGEGARLPSVVSRRAGWVASRVLGECVACGVVVAFVGGRLRLPVGFVFRGGMWGGVAVGAGGVAFSRVREWCPYVAWRFGAALVPVAHVLGASRVLGECVARLRGAVAGWP